MLTHYEYGNTANTQQLLIYLHGYDCAPLTDLSSLLPLTEKLPNACLLIPQAPLISEIHPDFFQWFSLLKYDPLQTRRQQQTSVTDIFAVYEAAQAEIAAQAQKINDFIEQMQIKYNVSAAHTYIIGFSQGAMMALYVGLTAAQTIGGIFAVSGLVAGKEKLSSQIRSYPQIYLYHGQDDNIVQYKTFATTLAWLKQHNLQVSTTVYPQIKHKIIAQEITSIADAIAHNEMHRLAK